MKLAASATWNISSSRGIANDSQELLDRVLDFFEVYLPAAGMLFVEAVVW